MIRWLEETGGKRGAAYDASFAESAARGWTCTPRRHVAGR